MWQAGTQTILWTEPNNGGYALFGGSTFWMEVVGSSSNFCPQIPFYPTPNSDDSVSSWVWFSANSSCVGVGITGNNATQYLGLQLVNYTQNLTYNWCKPVTWFETEGSCNVNAVTGGVAEWVLERPDESWDGRGPAVCANENFLANLIDVNDLAITQAKAYNTSWHWAGSYAGNAIQMNNTDPTFICDSNSGRELAAGVDFGSGIIEINWFNYN